MDHEDGVVSNDFIPSVGLSSSEAERLLSVWGLNELTEKTKPKVSQQFDKTGNNQ